jgi:hypothetical protein
VTQELDTFHLLRAANFEWAHTLAARLEQEEIPTQCNPVGAERSTSAQWAVYVRLEDLEIAREIDGEVMRELMPDVPEDFDPNAEDSGACPACGTMPPEGARECPECGLALLEA